MKKSSNNTGTIIWVAVILFWCGLIIYKDNSLNACQGLVDLFLLLVLVVLLSVFLGRQVYKTIKKANNFGVRVWTSLIVILACITAFQGKSTWKNIRLGNSILSASIHPDQLDLGRIELIDNNKYYAFYGHLDWSCSFTETYEKHGDTLILAEQPFAKTDGILADQYLITDSTLVPINLTGQDMKRTETMRIEIKK
ncbi:MAG: hypothetical protein ACWA41_06250 [Putridiphycobacter sp.]